MTSPQCHSGGMNIDRYVAALRDSLAASGRAAGSEVAEAADRLAVALEPSVRLVTLQVLADAADELTGQLGADPSIEVRLRGTDPELVVVLAPPTEDDEQPWPAAPVPPVPTPPVAPDLDDVDGSQTRITLRMPAPLKAQVDEAAARAGVSLNTWLVRAAQSALVPAPPAAQSGRSGKRLSGWAH